MSDWQHNGKVVSTVPEGAVGFLYQITNCLTGQAYVGKKLCWTRTRRKVTGKKRRKIVVKESLWRHYWGSSEYLLADIKQFGEDAFKREILNFYSTKVGLSYAEVEEQFKRDVLRATLADGSPAYYNKNVLGKYFRGKI